MNPTAVNALNKALEEEHEVLARMELRLAQAIAGVDSGSKLVAARKGAIEQLKKAIAELEKEST